MTNLYKEAVALGFDTVTFLNPAALKAQDDVREMCRADKCTIYGKNWGCPPHCGSVEECQARIRLCSFGLLVQTIGHMTKTIDSKCYRETERRHLENFYIFADAVRKKYPQAICLGTGGCRICEMCAYPDSCRFPEKVISSMEGYGLFVTQVCRDCGVRYHYGEGTITYTACVLI